MKCAKECLTRKPAAKHGQHRTDEKNTLIMKVVCCCFASTYCLIVFFSEMNALTFQPLVHLQDSDTLWQISPPAKAALSAILQEPAAALSFTWSLLRTAPLTSRQGGPLCTAEVVVPLAGESRQQLLEVRGDHC